MIREEYIKQRKSEAPWEHDKLIDPDYLNDMQGILRPGVDFDPKTAYARVRKTFLDAPFPENFKIA